MALRAKGINQKDKGIPILTKIGISFYENVKDRQNQEKSWDGKFRMAMFDVPESRKKQRDLIRRGLLQQGYSPLQKSVFIGKFPLDKEFVERLLEKDLYQYLRIIIVGDIDDDAVLENFS